MAHATNNRFGNYAEIKTTGILYADVKPGDRLCFMTRDTGFNGTGLAYRVGAVTKVTEKSITLDAEDWPGLSRTARIRRVDMPERCLGKVVDDTATEA